MDRQPRIVGDWGALSLLVLTLILIGCGQSALREPDTSNTVPDGGVTDGALPEIPTDLDFARSALFHERLVPLGGSTNIEDNRALAQAIREALTHRNPYNTDSLELFLREHPNSPWRASLLTNLGILWRGVGRYSRALDAWEEAWRLTRRDESWVGRGTADRAVSELALLNAQLGRRERLTELFAELRTRPPAGSAAERLGRAQLGWSAMDQHPERSFRCGPFAVGNVWRVLNPNRDVPKAIQEATSTAQGTSLHQLQMLSQTAGEPMQPMYRNPGSGIVVPSVVHWRIHHFAAVVGMEERPNGGRIYIIQDPTFGGEIRTTEAILDEEMSGYVLLPTRTQTPEGWREVSDAEAGSVWGRGETSSTDPDAFGDRDLQRPCEGSSRGMARYAFHLHAAALHIEDTPVWVTPAYGPPVDLRVSYNQADWSQAQLPSTTSFSGRWTHNWASFIEGNPHTHTLIHRMAGGGIAHHYATSAGDWQPEIRSGDVLEMTLPASPDLPEKIELRRRDGSHDTFSLIENGFHPRWYLIKHRDVHGNAVKLYYDNDRRLTEIKATSGESLSFSYRSNDASSQDFFLVSRVETNNNRYAEFNYEETNASSLLLNNIKDMAGIESKFEYSSASRGAEVDGGVPVSGGTPVPDPDFLSRLYTSYGTTTFSTGWSAVLGGSFSGRYLQRWLEAHLPTGEAERIEFREIESTSTDCGGLNPCGYSLSPADLLPATFLSHINDERGASGWSAFGAGMQSINLQYRNSYYWNTTGFARGRTVNGSGVTFDPRHAHTYHWIHPVEGNSSASAILESEAAPGESRVYYLYDGQRDLNYLRPADGITGSRRVLPTVISRLLSNSAGASAEAATTLTYDPNGNPREVIDPAGRGRCFTWSSDGTDLLSVHAVQAGGCTSLIHETITTARLIRIEYIAGGGHLPYRITDAAGQATEFVYNTVGQLLRETRVSDGVSTDYIYQFSSGSIPSSGYVGPAITPTKGRLLQVVFPVVNTTPAPPQRSITLTYDGNGNIQTVTDSDGVQRTYGYDGLDRVTSITAPGSRTETFNYDIRDASGASTGQPGLEITRSTNAIGDVRTLSYDAQHRLIRSAIATSDIVRYRYNQLTTTGFDLVQKLRGDENNDVLARWSVPSTTPPETPTLIGPPDPTFQQRVTARTRQGFTPVQTSSWTRDVVGRVTHFSEGSDHWAVEYRPDGLPTQLCEGTACSIFIPRTTFSYEPFDPDGYDTIAFQRLRHIEHFPGSAQGDYARTIGYVPLGSNGATLPASVGEFATGDTGTPTTTFTYNALGRLSSETNPNETITWYYDTFDRLDRITSSLYPGQNLIQLGYPTGNATRRHTAEDMPLYGCQATLSYHTASHDLRVSERLVSNTSTSAQLAQFATDYNLRDLLSTETNNGVQRAHNYSADNRLIWSDDYTGGSWLYRDYYYDTHGNATGHQASYYGVTTFWDSMTFDLGDHLVSRMRSNGPGSPSIPLVDSRGRLIADGDYTYTWDANDRLTSVSNLYNTTWLFRYDVNGQLRRFQEGGVWHRLVWVGGQLHQEYIGSSEISQPTLLRTFHVDGMTQGGVRYRYERDVRGSVRELIANGQVARAWSYDPWGQRADLLGSGSLESRISYAGYIVHADTGLYFTPARVYRPQVRRWLTRDPLGERHTVDGNNLYAYAANDPANYVDPSGNNAIANAVVSGLIEGGLYHAIGSLQHLESGCQPRIGSSIAVGAIGITGGFFAIAAGGATRLLPAPRYTPRGFANGQLQSHFAKHAGEWGAGNITQAGYLRRAQSLLGQDVGGDVLGAVRSNGDILRYNVRTNEFAVGAADGTTRTLFRPPDGMAYWLRQVGP